MGLLDLTDLLEVCTQQWNQEINPLKEAITMGVAALTTMVVEDMVHIKRDTSMDILDPSLLTLHLGALLRLGDHTISKVDHKTTTVPTLGVTTLPTVVC